MNFFYCVCIALLAFVLQACRSLEKEVDVKLPPYERKLVLESYLQEGQPYRAFLTETVSYFDTLPSNLFNPYNDARVVISDGEYVDTLRQENYFDIFNRKFYNFVGSISPAASNKRTYSLTVEDKKGRSIKGKCEFLPPPDLDSVEYFLRDSAARTLFWVNDPPEVDNYYRLIVHVDSLTGGPALAFELTDANLNGKRFPIGTGYRFKIGQKLFIKLYHITKAHYDYLEGLEDASRANGNPFAQPVAINSSLLGGYGIFTALSFAERELRIEKK